MLEEGGKILMRTALHAFLIGAICVCHSHAQSPPSSREQLQQDVVQLQKNPSDDALRENTIKLWLTLDPKPAIPEEARRHFVKADTLAHDVHAPADVPPAVQEYQQALAIAPWWADAYHDLAVILEVGKRWDEAKRNLHFYLLTNPGEKEARAAQDEIYRIEAKQDEATKRAAEERMKLAGMWHRYWGSEKDQRGYLLEINTTSDSYTARLNPEVIHIKTFYGEAENTLTDFNVNGHAVAFTLISQLYFSGNGRRFRRELHYQLELLSGRLIGQETCIGDVSAGICPSSHSVRDVQFLPEPE
jgi:tetratricopeptide (TPR) repeat protein